MSVLQIPAIPPLDSVLLRQKAALCFLLPFYQVPESHLVPSLLED